MGRVTRDYLINYRQTPTQCSPNIFKVLRCVDMLNRKIGTNLTWHDVNQVYNCQKWEKTKYYIKCSVPAIRLISCLPDSSKGIDEDFLIVLGNWHDGMHYPTQEEELGRVPEDRSHAQDFTWLYQYESFLSFFFLLTTPFVLLGRRIPYCPSQALGEFQGLESDPQGRDLPTQGWSTSSISCHSWIQALH